DISEGMMLALQSYDWPGNVRELENTCERIAESCSCGDLRVGCLGASVLFPSIELPEPIDDEPGDAAPERSSDASRRPADVPVGRGLSRAGSGAPEGTPYTDVAALPDWLAEVGRPGFSLDERLRKIEALFIQAALEQTRG